MLGETLKQLRKERGLSQEELAGRLHVVRQTVSKWEKGLSVPDAALLIQLADILEVSTAQLLGESRPVSGEADEIAVLLARINEQLAAKNRHARSVWRGILIAAAVLAGVFVLSLLVTFLLSAAVWGQIAD